jgi:hypothetical protein
MTSTYPLRAIERRHFEGDTAIFTWKENHLRHVDDTRFVVVISAVERRRKVGIATGIQVGEDHAIAEFRYPGFEPLEINAVDAAFSIVLDVLSSKDWASDTSSLGIGIGGIGDGQVRMVNDAIIRDVKAWRAVNFDLRLLDEEQYRYMRLYRGNIRLIADKLFPLEIAGVWVVVLSLDADAGDNLAQEAALEMLRIKAG